MPAIAVAGAVVRGSPAEDGGIREHDEIVHFGSANSGNTPTLSLLLDLIRRSVGIELSVIVRRPSGDGVSSSVVELAVTPGPWGGSGILGLHLLPPPTASA